MIDLKFLRENPDLVRDSQRTRGANPILVDQLIAADESRRAAIKVADELKAEQNAFGKKIGQAAPEDRPALLAGANELKAKVKAAEDARKEAEAAVTDLQMRIDNIVEGAPAGGEDDFVVLEHVGEPRSFDFTPKDHLDLGISLGLIDMDRDFWANTRKKSIISNEMTYIWWVHPRSLLLDITRMRSLI